MTTPELTLKNVQKTAETKQRVARASDFLTQEEIEEVHQSNAKGKAKTGFDIIDAYVAEILARFGYDAYVAWKFGEIDDAMMSKFIQAERAREAKNRLKIESVIVSAVAGSNNPTKHETMPKSLKNAYKMLKLEHNDAKEADR